MVVKKAKFSSIIDLKLRWTNLTPQKGSYCFGYYDRNPFSKDNKFHLSIKFNQQTRLPIPGENATIGLIDLESKEFIPITDTEAWCHQQGSMTQWIPNENNQFIFNDFIKLSDGNWKPISRIYNTNGKHLKDLDYPIYILSHNGEWGLTLNFSRIPRRGYSYARAPLPDENLPDIENDGLFIINMKTLEKKLILNYKQLLNYPRGPIQKNYSKPNEYSMLYHWMNHASFNVDDSRVMILHRYQSSLKNWKTDLWSCKLDGTDLICSFPNEMWSKWHVSHQLWGRCPREILVDGMVSFKKFKIPTTNYWVFDEIKGYNFPQLISKGTNQSGHLNFSPDFKWILGDTYSHNNTQKLCITNVSTKKCKIIGKFYHSSEQKGDWRCDLHPRWSGDGKYISVDTIHFGERKILIVEMEEIERLLFK